MMRKLRNASPALILLLLALSSLALAPSAHISQILTPVLTVPAIIKPTPVPRILQAATSTPTKTKTVPLVAQAGNSDRIVLIGILIFGIIVVPILLQRKEWLGN
jgi:methylaspartate ammonia-lyase